MSTFFSGGSMFQDPKSGARDFLTALNNAKNKDWYTPQAVGSTLRYGTGQFVKTPQGNRQFGDFINSYAPEGYRWARTGSQPWSNYVWSGDSQYSDNQRGSNDIYTLFYQGQAAGDNKDDAPKDDDTPEDTPPEWWTTSAAADYRQKLLQSWEAINSKIGDLGNLNYYKYWETDKINAAEQLKKQLRQMYNNTNLSRLNDAFKGQYALDKPNFGTLDQQIRAANAIIQRLRGEYGTEEARVNDFVARLLGLSDELSGEVPNLGINDYDRIKELVDIIDSRQREIGRFNTKIDTGQLPAYSDEIQGWEDKLRALLGEREMEQGRIKEEGSDLDSLLNTIRDAISGSDIYSGENLQDISGDINDILQRISGFESDLPFDFSSYQGEAGDAKTLLDELLGKRKTRLDEILNAALGAGQEAQLADLWNEDAIKAALNKLYTERQNITPFSGGNRQDIYDQILQAISGAEGRLTQLGEYRGGIEQDAQELLDQIRAARFGQVGQLDPYQAQLDALRAEMEKYGASQANDELAAILGELTGNRQRIENDARLREERRRQEQSRQQSMYSPVNINTGAPTGYFRPDEQTGGFDLSAFARALGLA